MIRKRITTAGNSAALLLSQDVLGLMGVGIGDEVELRLVDRSLLVRPLGESARVAVVGAAVDRVFREHDGLLRKLAEGVGAPAPRKRRRAPATGKRRARQG